MTDEEEKKASRDEDRKYLRTRRSELLRRKGPFLTYLAGIVAIQSVGAEVSHRFV